MNEPIKRVYIKLDPGLLMVGGVAAGFLYGALMVFLDPWVRFPGVPLQFNWREALLTASILGVYGALMTWTVTTFWRSAALWLASLLTAPLVGGVIAAWNNATGALGIETDLRLFVPFIMILHVVFMAMTVLYLRMTLLLPWRRALAFSAVPIVLALFAFLAMGRARWNNPDAVHVMNATEDYADAAFGSDYKIELVSLHYSAESAPIGTTRIYGQEQTLECRVRLFLDDSDIRCEAQRE
jgi:hypothetical protein